MAEPSGDVLNRKLASNADIDKRCGDAEEAIAALRMSYEQYFLGMERRPPSLQHNALKKQIQDLRNTFSRQTATKFRVQSIHNKFLTYERLWARTLQEIEAGTYRRDLFKAKLHQQERDAKAKEKKEVEPSKEAAKAAAPAAGAPAKVAPKPAAVAPANLSAALSDQKLKAVFDAYVTAKKQCKEDTSKLNYEQVAANLRKQVPDLVKKAGLNDVEFKIVIRDGKAVLRAVPK